MNARTGERPEAGLRGAGRACRLCGRELSHTFVDLGMSPLCESYLDASQLDAGEVFYPLHAYVCDGCFLVQLHEFAGPEEIFSEYAYFSSYSTAWLEHARVFTDMIVARLDLDLDSFVVEVASNDGYLLRNFVARGIPALGVEPAANVVDAAADLGVETLVDFFDSGLAKRITAERRRADLIVGNNVLAQVPDLHSFVDGLSILLAPEGTITLEFPHLVRLMQDNQFDTIYHEHFSYFSLLSAETLLAEHGLAVYQVDELWTHGGSLRIYAKHASTESLPEAAGVERLRRHENELGLSDINTYARFAPGVEEAKRALLEFLIGAKRAGKRVVGYGAPGKGNTLLNYCGIRTDLVDFTVDKNPFKQGKFLPGVHIPVYEPSRLDAAQPDYVLVLPWNLKEEIMAQLAHVSSWGGKFVIPIPSVEVLS